MMLGQELKKIRLAQGFVLREVAEELSVDIGYISRIESGEKQISKKQLQRLALLYKADESKLNMLWLTDKILNVVENEKEAAESIKMAQKEIRARI